MVIMTDDKHYKATTRAEKLRRIKLAIKFIMRQEDNPELYYRAKRAVDEIDEWCHGLGKQIALQRQEYALVLRKELPEIVDPNEFMEQDKVHNQLYMCLCLCVCVCVCDRVCENQPSPCIN